MSVTTSAVLRISSRSRFMRHVLAIDAQDSRTCPAIPWDLVDNHMQAIRLRSAVLDHGIRDRLTKTTLLLHRSSRPHVYLYNWHGSVAPLRGDDERRRSTRKARLRSESTRPRVQPVA